MKEKCPVCGSEAEKTSYNKDQILNYKYDCARCGSFGLSHDLGDLIKDYFKRNFDEKERNCKISALCHHMAKNSYSAKNQFYFLPWDVFDQIKHDLKLPNPAEQADNLIIYIGESARFHTDQIKIEPLRLAALIGAYKEKSISLITNELYKQELIENYIESGQKFYEPGTRLVLSLTFKGWQRYEELKKVRKDSKQVFMAMQFGNSQLNDLFNNHLVKAVKQTGLDLRKLTDIPKDGIIDNHLRVEIRKSCLLIADLSDDNHGAYWEAGYAEGLGKPVIYLCEETKFKKESTHFDTSHLQTILWKTGKEEECVKKLKDLIRVTLPDKAKMEDE